MAKGFEALKEDTQQLIIDITTLKMKAAELMLPGTCKALDEVVKKVGWELAAKIKKNLDKIEEAYHV